MLLRTLGRPLLTTAVVAILLVAAGESRAVPITVPGGLDPGDQYRLAFVTSGTNSAVITDINFYNAFVSAAANSVPELAALGTGWRAIASTSAVRAWDNTSTNPGGGPGVPIYLLDGSLLATGNADLWDGTIGTPGAPRFDEHGNVLFDLVWTGTNPGGTQAVPLGTGTPTYGRSDVFGSPWVQAGTRPATDSYHFYAISSTLTVIPEPGTAALVMLGVIGLAGQRRSVSR